MEFCVKLLHPLFQYIHSFYHYYCCIIPFCKQHYSNKDSDISMSDTTWKFCIVPMFITFGMHIETPHWSYGVGTFMIQLHRGITNFLKFSPPPPKFLMPGKWHNARTILRTHKYCHHIEFSHSENLAAWICAPLCLQYQTAYKQIQFVWTVTTLWFYILQNYYHKQPHIFPRSIGIQAPQVSVDPT